MLCDKATSLNSPVIKSVFSVQEGQSSYQLTLQSCQSYYSYSAFQRVKPKDD